MSRAEFPEFQPRPTAFYAIIRPLTRIAIKKSGEHRLSLQRHQLTLCIMSDSARSRQIFFRACATIKILNNDGKSIFFSGYPVRHRVWVALSSKPFWEKALKS